MGIQEDGNKTDFLGSSVHVDTSQSTKAYYVCPPNFLLFFLEILPWADLSVLYIEPVFRSAQHYMNSYISLSLCVMGNDIACIQFFMDCNL